MSLIRAVFCSDKMGITKWLTRGDGWDIFIYWWETVDKSGEK